MQIRTKEFNVSPKELRQILINFYVPQLKSMAILYTTILLIALAAYFIFYSSVFLLLLGAATLVMAIALAVPFIQNVKKQQNNLQFQQRHCEIDDEFISTFFEDGSSDKIKLDNFRRVVRKSGYYFLYLTKVQFYYVPIAAFHSEDDLKDFNDLLKEKELLEKT